ncbi:hypothetical protein HO133_009804 [Letharia lupina]|uniref:Uncharacterized protein n=1 Tax=Letharia lupina TaxID=560253 RepID=A0A8H6FER3_9LECA|nr:uncharacterized protein HO133_009804 [Letharia lupina]KAF6225802.1 hypothetical protein HO133_009804 [Letharia lupina]
MAATTGWKDDLEVPHPFPVASNLPMNTPPLAESAVSSFSGSGGIRKSTIDMKKKTQLRISGPAPAHRIRAIYDQKIAALENEVNCLRNWWWVDMMDRPDKRDWGQDGRWSEIYKREHWLRGLELAANGWVKADFAREKMMQADMRAKEREARKAKEAAEKAKRELATAKIVLAAVRRELEEKNDQVAMDRQLAMTLLAATQ